MFGVPSDQLGKAMTSPHGGPTAIRAMLAGASAKIAPFAAAGILFLSLIAQGKKLIDRKTGSTATPGQRSGRSSGPSTAGFMAGAAPSCPQCNAPMIEKTARKGPTAGSKFWSCSRFPACRGSRAYAG